MAGSISAQARTNTRDWGWRIGIGPERIDRIFDAGVAAGIAWSVDASPTSDADLTPILLRLFRREGLHDTHVARFLEVMNAIGPASQLLNGLATVPDLEGLPLSAAETALNDAGLILGTVTQNDDAGEFAIGEVSAQGTAADQTATVNTAVNVTVQEGQVVPTLVGETWTDVLAALETATLTVGEVTIVEEGGDPGEVLAASEEPDALLDSGASIDFTVVGTEVPAASGVAVATFETALATALLEEGDLTSTFTDDADHPDGDVISADPAEGTFVLPGTAVDYVVSGGPAYTP